ncbi:AAA family ATPase [Amycolatopsis samaneae]|uniref:AAA family ATPase n=1 Tax=Amycolatopsis samaneae TaxID=664691 RepID=A0ABW5GBI1_9PSEU
MNRPLVDGPVITGLAVRNYRVLRDVTFSELMPLTVLLGPNGSGKSTVLDVLAFLSDAVEDGVGSAAARRGGLSALRSFGSSGPVEVTVECRFAPVEHRYRYRLRLAVDDTTPVAEILEQRAAGQTDWQPLLDFAGGSGAVYGRTREVIEGDLLALDTLGRLSRFDGIKRFRQFVLGWRNVDIDVARVRAGVPAGVTGSRNSLWRAPDGADLVRVLRDLEGTGEYDELIRDLRRLVPKLESVRVEHTAEGRLLIRLKDRTFDETAPSDAVSEGTLKLLAQLVAIRRSGASVLTVEEPENNVHPKLHYPLAEDFRRGTASGQIIVATHSPRFVDAVRPDELWTMYRGEDGYARVRRAADLPRVTAMLEAGGALGDLWTEGYFGVGDPLADSR